MFEILISVAFFLAVMHFFGRIEKLEERVHNLECPHRFSTEVFLTSLANVKKKKSK